MVDLLSSPLKPASAVGSPLFHMVPECAFRSHLSILQYLFMLPIFTYKILSYTGEETHIEPDGMDPWKTVFLSTRRGFQVPYSFFRV